MPTDIPDLDTPPATFEEAVNRARRENELSAAPTMGTLKAAAVAALAAGRVLRTTCLFLWTCLQVSADEGRQEFRRLRGRQ